MKKVLIISIVIFNSLVLSAQEQYCQVIAKPGLLSSKVTIDIDFAEEKNFWRDSRLKTYDGRFKKINTVIDALNLWEGMAGYLLMHILFVLGKLKFIILLTKSNTLGQISSITGHTA
ncbi:MAG: hypothetical protein H7Z13_01115 [Ferruginibacter sp.]|nr:hypothetical protein [Ferruginibacter sp.]